MSNKEFQANIYTPDWQFIAVLTDYISMIWTDRYYELGDFELILPLTKENLQIYAVDNYIICNQSDKVMIIEEVQTSVSSSGYKLRVKGHSAESLLTRRIIPDEFISNRNVSNELPIKAGNKNSKFAGQLAAAFSMAFASTEMHLMNENSSGDVSLKATDTKHLMQILRFAGVVSDPFGHIADATANIDAYGQTYYDVIQSQCESKDIGFAVYRNFDIEIDRSTNSSDDDIEKISGLIAQANTDQLFDLVIYDGWDRSFIDSSGVSMTKEIDGRHYVVAKGIIFSVEYLNLSSSDSSYSSENGKNYIYVNGGEVDTSAVEVDVAEATANFTKVYKETEPMHYQVGVGSMDIGIFRKETYIDSGLDRGGSTRRGYAMRLKAVGERELKKYKDEWTLSAQITNVSDYIYGTDYYLGDIVSVKDSMDNYEKFRVTEEIISSDANGLVMYPTLVKYDPDKFIADDSIDSTYDPEGTSVSFHFNGGKLGSEEDLQPIIDLWVNLSAFIESPDKDITLHEPGDIIDTIPSWDDWTNRSRLRPDSIDNLKNLRKYLQGVVTYQEVGEYIIFPTLLGTPNTDPNESGDYKVENIYVNGEHEISQELRCWTGWNNNNRFIPHREMITYEEGIVCPNNGTIYYAFWAMPYYRITFEHGDGGKFWSYGYSYCKINEIEQYQSQPPHWSSIAVYERVKDWYEEGYVYNLLHTMPPGWSTPGSSTYYTHYYTPTGKDKLDKVIKDFRAGSVFMNYDLPKLVSLPGYTRATPAWEPELTPVWEDKTYTAKWIAPDADENDEDPDDDDDRDQDDEQGPTRVPTKHKQAKVVYTDSNDNAVVDATGYTLVSFRHKKSRVGDKFELQNGSMVKVRDGDGQYDAFYYVNNIGIKHEDGTYSATLQIYWPGDYTRSAWPNGSYFYGPGLAVVRDDGAIICNLDWNSASFNAALGYGGVEVALTNSPVVRKIIGYKALTSNPFTDSDTWTANKIYAKNGNNYTAVNSKPAGWDEGGWINYYIKGQIGAKYGFTCQSYDDMGILYTPVWVRAGVIDHPIIPLVQGSVPYDVGTYYTSNALSITTAYTRILAETIVGGYIYTKMISNYHASGWKWTDVPDGRWHYPKTGGRTPVTSNVPFIYTDKYGAMFEDEDGTALIHMPADWNENYSSYYYAANSHYAPRTGLNGYVYGDIIGNHYQDCYNGCSGAGGGLILPKLAGNDKSFMVSILGVTSHQHVKPGEVATFNVRAISLILGAKLDYIWEMQAPGQGSWTSLGSLGPTYSFVTSASQDGTTFRCTVNASVTILGETLTGSESAGEMYLAVDDQGTDGKPTPKDPTEEEAQKPTDPADPSGTSAQSQSPHPLEIAEDGNYYQPAFAGSKSNSDGTSTAKYNNYKWVGEGTPYNTDAHTNDDDYKNDPNWEYVSTSTRDIGSSSGASSKGDSGSDIDDGIVTLNGKIIDLTDIPPEKREEALRAAQSETPSAIYNYSRSTDNYIKVMEAENGIYELQD